MKMDSLRIADGVSLPPNTSTQSITILAKRRVGKSYTMRKIWEQLLKINQQVVVVDPKGDQWGIRSSADGKKPGFPVLILGGEHGDLPLEKESGELIAKLVVEQQVNILLDTSHFSKTARAVFMASFLENIYRLKAQEKYRTPLCIVIDEADEIAPQRPQKDEYRMLGAIDDIVRRGGQRGLGSILVTQRSASLNKNVLTQSEMLILMRTIAPQDLEAVKAWIDVHGTADQRKIIMAELPSLPRGDAYFWSPAWPTDEGMFKRAHILSIETFDSAKTPEAGERRVIPKNLADIDLSALKGQMDATIEKAKRDNPTELRKEIARLTLELSKEQKTDTSKTDPKATERLVEMAVKDALAARDKEWEEKVFVMQGEWLKQIQNWFSIMEGIAEAMKKVSAEFGKKKPLVVKKASLMPTAHVSQPTRQREVVQTLSVEGNLTGPEQRVLDAMAWMHSIGIQEPEQTAVAFLAGYTYGGGGFNNPRGALKTKGFVEYIAGNKIKLSPEGQAVANVPPDTLTTEELHQKVLSVLETPHQKILKPLLEKYPDALSNEELAELSGYKLGSGGFNNPKGRLRSLGLIEYQTGGMVRARDILFLQ